MWRISSDINANCGDRIDMATAIENALEQAIAQIGSTILGKEHAIRLALSCLLARGHLLIEDLPGMGKTTLAHALAAHGHRRGQGARQVWGQCAGDGGTRAAQAL
jgi:hypothetical protein